MEHYVDFLPAMSHLRLVGQVHAGTDRLTWGAFVRHVALDGIEAHIDFSPEDVQLQTVVAQSHARQDLTDSTLLLDNVMPAHQGHVALYRLVTWALQVYGVTARDADLRDLREAARELIPAPRTGRATKRYLDFRHAEDLWVAAAIRRVGAVPLEG